MDNEALKRLIEKYKLSENEHNALLNKLITRIFANKSPENKPSAMFVIGQPGCGKTTFIQNSDLSGYTNINSDEYRTLNKYSEEILEQYSTYYTKLTNHDAHLWGDELFSYAVNNGYSVLREKAPVDYSLLEAIKAVPNSFDLLIMVVVTGNLQSLLATRERYEKGILQSKNARLSNIEAHNKCYELLPDFISNCLLLGARVNYAVPKNNGFEIVPVSENFRDLLERLRKESNEQACLEFATRMKSIKAAMLNRNASPEQFDELDKIERAYSEIINKNSIDNRTEDLEDER